MPAVHLCLIASVIIPRILGETGTWVIVSILAAKLHDYLKQFEVNCLPTEEQFILDVGERRQVCFSRQTLVDCLAHAQSHRVQEVIAGDNPEI